MIKKVNGGLSLIELLLVIAVSVVLISSGYASFRTGVFGYKKIENKIELCQSASLALDRIEADLRNSFCYSSSGCKFNGEEDKVSFFSLIDHYKEEGFMVEYACVSYGLANETLLRACKVNTGSMNSRYEVIPEEVINGVKTVDFNYGFMNSETGLIEYSDNYSNMETLPCLVKISFSVQSKNENAPVSFQRTVFLPLGG